MKKFHYVIIGSVFAVILLCDYWQINTVYDSDKPAKQLFIHHDSDNSTKSTVQSTVPRLFRILIWTKYSPGDRQYFDLSKLNCEYSNCRFTDDRTLQPTSDALLFHWRELNTRDMPAEHYPHQKWVLHNWESVRYSSVAKIKPVADRFDWLMSYKKDSDVYLPYGYVKKCTNKWSNDDLFDNKSKSIAWIVSNCRTPGKRDRVVAKLAKYIDVDIYGHCGRHQCKRGGSSCYESIAKDYKFYLSFENTLCKDYVTEKLFRTLKYDIIPIVYGSANYKSILPENSFISVFDFNSTEALVSRLRELSSDKVKYNSYMNWKNGFCSETPFMSYMCELCKKLNQQDSHHTEQSRSILERWNVSEECFDPMNVAKQFLN